LDTFADPGSGCTPPSSGPELRTTDEPELLSRREDGAELAMALWRFTSPLLALSSAPYGGGWGERRWVLAAQVAGGYSRSDPAGHLAELARGLGLDGPGIGMLTAVDVRLVSTCREDGVMAAATVGISHPAWAAETGAAQATAVETGPTQAGPPDAGPAEAGRPATGTADAAPTGAAGFGGTVNIVAVLGRRLSPAALVNAVMTVTEAKSQALWEAGFPGTGTASDAVAVLCPAAGPAEAFAGPRSVWGSRLARAAHGAVLDGSRRWAEAR
jgi:adenosylcobinamide hydrolase